MIDGLSEGKIETGNEQEDVGVELATIVSVGTSGLLLQFDGEDETRDKEYRCNAGVQFKEGDRVKIHKMSGTYVVDYPIGDPNSAVPWGLPSGGSAGQILKRTSQGAEWEYEKQELPSGGSAGQILKRTSQGAEWANEKQELPSGGSTGQVLTLSYGQAKWETPKAATPTEMKNGSYYLRISNLGAVSCNCQSLGFFGATPTSKKYLSASASLTDVINLLKAYGLG